MAKKNSQKNTKDKVIRKKQLKGRVISDKMTKTIVVQVDRMKMHPLYKKKYRGNKKYKVHDEKGEAKTGDEVIFEQCRPLSKDKRWRLIKIINK